MKNKSKICSKCFRLLNKKIVQSDNLKIIKYNKQTKREFKINKKVILKFQSMQKD